MTTLPPWRGTTTVSRHCRSACGWPFTSAAPRCQRQQGPENVMHASHQGIGRKRCGVFYVKMVRRLMAPAGIKGGDEAVRNGAAQDDLFAALLYQHPLAC